MLTSEKIIERLFQENAEANTANEATKILLEKADAESKAVLTYLTETGPEVREILDRMLKQALANEVQKRHLRLQDS